MGCDFSKEGDESVRVGLLWLRIEVVTVARGVRSWRNGGVMDHWT